MANLASPNNTLFGNTFYMKKFIFNILYYKFIKKK